MARELRAQRTRSHRHPRHRLAVAAPPLPRALDQGLRPAHPRSPARQRRDQSPDHANGGGQSALGRSTNPWRAAQARPGRGRAHRLAITPEATLPAVADLANLPGQSCPKLGLDRFLHRAHRSAPRPVRRGRAPPPSPARRPLQRHRASHRRLDHPADRRRVPGRLRAALPPPRSRQRLRAGVSATRQEHGDPRRPHGAPQPVAKSLRGAAHRLDPAGASRSCRRPRRKTPAPHPDPLLRVLSPGSHSSLARQGHTRRTANRATGPGHDHPDSRSRWPASSLRPPGGVVSAPHPPIFIATNAYTPAASLLPPGRRPSSPLRKTSSHRVKSTARGCRQPLPPYESSASCRLSEQRERSPSEADAVLAKDSAPRIHGELMKLGFNVAERTVSRLMPRRRSPPSQTWRTFLDNHVRDLVALDFFTVPTAGLRVLFVLIVLAHHRRPVVHFNLTEYPTAHWTAQQIIDAFPDDSGPSYLLRDHDQIYGEHFRRRVKGMRIEEVIISLHSPWQNPFAARLIG